jgi:hypothetical protein
MFLADRGFIGRRGDWVNIRPTQRPKRPLLEPISLLRSRRGRAIFQQDQGLQTETCDENFVASDLAFSLAA